MGDGDGGGSREIGGLGGNAGMAESGVATAVGIDDEAESGVATAAAAVDEAAGRAVVGD